MGGIGALNPIRYRGYYWDGEVKLYYLNARYYDPEVGRFISQDSIKYLAPETLNGINLFAYCLNNPVMETDPQGTFFALLLFTPIGGIFAQTVTSVVSYAGMAVASIWDEDIRSDMNAIGWNPFNSNEDAVLSSNKVSFYKGMPVFRTDLDRSGSFYAIFLNQTANVDTLRHERGHGYQAMMMGIVTYGLMIGLPSAFEWSTRPYYERPWEITADILGEVTGRTHKQEDINRGFWYLAISSLFGPWAYFFLLGEY